MPWKKVTLMDQKQRFVILAATGKFYGDFRSLTGPSDHAAARLQRVVA